MILPGVMLPRVMTIWLQMQSSAWQSPQIPRSQQGVLPGNRCASVSYTHLPVAPWLVVIVIAIVAVVRIMSVGTLAASIAYPILFWIYLPDGANLPLYLSFAVAMVLLSFFCHRCV